MDLSNRGNNMARARNIKPNFYKNYELADCGAYAQLLFSGLWCLADREGLLEDKPRFIKAEIFPYYDVDINGELTKLQRLKFIDRYTENGIDVIEIVNFKKHQSPHHTEKKSELPNRSASACKLKENSLTVTSPLLNGENPPDSLIPDSLIPDSLEKKINKKKNPTFQKPTMEEIETHIIEKKLSVNAQTFFLHYEANGWMVGKNKMKCWKSALSGWDSRQRSSQTPEKEILPKRRVF